MAGSVKIGSLILDGAPRVAVVIDRPLPGQEIAGLAGRGADLLEIRFDLFADGLVAAIDYASAIREHTALPLLGTLRENDSNRADRLSAFERLIPLVDAVDIEVDADIRDAVVQAAAGKTVVVSEHDFGGMPDNARLEELVAQSVAAGADIAKIAGTATEREDAARLLTFCSRCQHPMVAIAMGRFGAASRLLGSLFGSLFTYSFVSEAVAPGQIGLEELVADLRRYYP